MKEEVLSFLRKLARERGWQVNWQKVSRWQPRPKQRSFYSFVTLKDGKRAFYKYSLHPSLHVNFLRELTFLEYVGQHFPSLVPKVYAACRGEEGACWFLIEALDTKKGVICEGEKTAVLEKKWVPWILEGLVKLRQLPKEGEFPPKLFKHSYHQAYQGTLAFYQERIKERLSVIEKHKKLFPQPFPYNKVRQFVQKIAPKIKKAENGPALLLQGDFAPNNLYFNLEKKRVVFLDWEWASLNRNRLIGAAFDFANLYLRLWQNQIFQEEFLKKFQEKKLAAREEIKVAVVLQCVNQLNGLFIKRERGEEGEYLSRHLRRLLESLQKILED